MTDMMDQMSLQQEPGGYDGHEPISERPLTGESSERRMRMRPQRKQRAKMLSAFEANRRAEGIQAPGASGDGERE